MKVKSETLSRPHKAGPRFSGKEEGTKEGTKKKKPRGPGRKKYAAARVREARERDRSRRGPRDRRRLSVRHSHRPIGDVGGWCGLALDPLRTRSHPSVAGPPSEGDASACVSKRSPLNVVVLSPSPPQATAPRVLTHRVTTRPSRSSAHARFAERSSPSTCPRPTTRIDSHFVLDSYQRSFQVRFDRSRLPTNSSTSPVALQNTLRTYPREPKYTQSHHTLKHQNVEFSIDTVGGRRRRRPPRSATPAA